MKKYLPILLLALLALAGCHREPAVYTPSVDGENIIENIEAFTADVVKDSRHYSDADWEVVTFQFVAMCKDYKMNEWRLFEPERERFNEACRDYAHAIEAVHKDELLNTTKRYYREIVELGR